MKFKLTVAVALVWASGVFGGVFDDAKIWVRTADDKNGDGWVKTTRSNADTKDFPNALKGGVAKDGTHTWSARGPATNIHVVVGNVVNPLAQTTNESAYLHFDQPTPSEGDTTGYYYGGMVSGNFMPAVTNVDPRTVYMRFRLDSFMENSECANLVTLGHSAGTSGNHGGWKLMLVPDESGAYFHFKVVNGRAVDNSTETGGGTKEFTDCTNAVNRLCPGKWIDVVMACGGESGCGARDGNFMVDVYSCAEGKKFNGESQEIGIARAQGSYNANCWLASNGTTLNDFRRAFRGDIAAFAYWDRRLTEDEAYAVMASPRNDVFALGVKNGSADEFAGKAGAIVDVAATNAFAAVPASLAAGESFSISFTLDEKSGYGLPQAFRLAAAAGSATASFRIVPNGLTDKGQTIQASPESEAVAVFRAKDFHQGTNTIQVTRMDAGTTAFLPDAVSLGGSWSIGRRDDSHAEFAYTSAADTTRFTRTADANWRHTVINLANSGSYATNRLYACVDSVLAAARRFRFVARLRPMRDKTKERRAMSVQFRLNSGTAKSIQMTETDYDGYRDFNFDIEPGELVGGVNCFELTNTSGAPTDSPASDFISFDCRQLKVMPDPAGFRIVVQ